MKKKRCTRFLLLLALITLVGPVKAQRIVEGINSGWKFYKGDLEGFPGKKTQVKWENISLPHTWNATDVLDDEPGYYRGTGWYTRKLSVPASWKNKEVYVYFEGASQVTEVYLNGKKIGAHTGGYTFFSFPATAFLNFDAKGNAVNEIQVKVDNRFNENVPPYSADFTFYGGIYRDVYLIAANPVHFDLDNHASSGIFLHTPKVTNDVAEVAINGAFVNELPQSKRIEINTSIFDHQGVLIASKKNTFKVAGKEKLSFQQNIKNILKPVLWSPEHPYLYRVTTTLRAVDSKEILDEVSNPLGFRWFNFDPEKGFFLNGHTCKLIGTSRHQDYKGIGNALPDALHVRDIQLLKDMGGNFIRVSHYPQDPEILQACDRLGILASVEIPVVNRITESQVFYDNCKAMQTEMIRQNFNHPSVIIWGYMNEILLQLRYDKGSEQQEQYLKRVAGLARSLDSLTRREDPSRYTMIANHGAFDLYHQAGLTKIPMLTGWNIYQGWYSGNLDGFGKFLDRHHKELPGMPMLVTEYGADGDPRLHSMEPVRFDKSLEYQVIYHRAYLKAIEERPFVAGAAIWNLADFNSEIREETTAHTNAKGISTADRQPKDAYLFYQSRLLKIPFLKIGSRNWTLRGGIAESDTLLQCKQPVEVYTNQETVTLRLNGHLVGTEKAIYGTATFLIPFVNGHNHLEAISVSANGDTCDDQTEINFKLLPKSLKSVKIPFQELNVSLGDQRYFIDDELQQVWMPEKPYEPGSWGYTGGEVFVMKGSTRHPYGSDKNILGTSYDSIYETQRVGLTQFKLDVPDGSYEVTLHFAELLSNLKKQQLIYNLSSGEQKEIAINRSFDVVINHNSVLENLSNANYLEPETAWSSKTKILVEKGTGIVIEFNAKEGKTILNGLQVRRLY